MVASARGSRAFIVAAIMASMFMIAIETTIVSTAMPLIVAQLGGMDIYAWVFAIFLLAQTAITVVFGKLADVYGRKPIMLSGIGIFLVGSLLAGFAWSMPSLIVFRLIQGVGAGAVQPVAMTIVADLYPARERGKVQGYLASVWAFSAIVGPVAGGAIVHALSWSWIFWINIPIGLAAMAAYVAWLHEDVAHTSPSIDYAGAILFAAAVGALMFALSGIGTSYEREALAAAAAFVVLAVWFVLHERRVADPMVSFELWRRRAVATANMVALLASVALMGLTVFLPMYVQIVLGRSPIVAGFALTTMILGWPLGATIAAHTFHRFGLRNTLIAGSVLEPLGALCFVLLTPQSSPLLAAFGSAVMGFGMGLLSTSCLVLIQEAAGATERGSATASNLFARNLGSALGATVFGVVVNLGLAGTSVSGRVTADDLKRLLEASGNGSSSSQQLVATLNSALHTMFTAMLVVSSLIVVVALFVPNRWFKRVKKGSGRTERPA